VAIQLSSNALPEKPRRVILPMAPKKNRPAKPTAVAGRLVTPSIIQSGAMTKQDCAGRIRRKTLTTSKIRDLYNPMQ
jgi:hypothetical protein